MENLGKKLDAATSGEITCRLFAGGVLGSEKEVIEQTQIGSVQLTRVSLGAVGPVVLDVNVFNMPFVFRDHAHMRKVIDGEIGQEILDKITASEFNMVGLAWMDRRVENNPPTMLERNANYYSLTGHLIIPEPLMMAKTTWDQLPPEQQALVKQFAREAQMEERVRWDAKSASSEAKLKEAGVEFIEVDKQPFYDATAPVREKYGAPYAELIKRIEAVQ